MSAKMWHLYKHAKKQALFSIL